MICKNKEKEERKIEKGEDRKNETFIKKKK